ncbi:MAG TPA: TIGR03086 family metal-binding protein, partial [Pseudonocardia sp.]|nr:TIGR03086 family metal-binding protein [Pseudonocardia sp.]
VRTLADGVPADRLADPTPCTEWDVRGLLGHLVATVDRVRVIGEGGDPQTVPRVVEGIADDGWTDALDAAEDKMAAVWADDAVLDELVTVPWGRVPGRAAVWGYIREALVHGWDLAVATGQSPEADPVTAEAALAETKLVMPAEPRGGPIPFAAPVSPRPGAGPTEQLANWCGHARV